MDSAGCRDFFLGLTQQQISSGALSVAADMLAIAAGFDALVQVGSQDPHPSAFDERLWPIIDLELIAAGHRPVFKGQASPPAPPP